MSCTFLVGYIGDCEDIDECKHSPCNGNAECVNTKGSYKCTCKAPYWVGNETWCKPTFKNLCASRQTPCSKENEICNNTGTGTECICKSE